MMYTNRGVYKGLFKRFGRHATLCVQTHPLIVIEPKKLTDIILRRFTQFYNETRRI